MATVKKKPSAKKKKKPAPKTQSARKAAPAKTTPARKVHPVVVAPATPPPIPFDIAPHFARVREAVGQLVAKLKRKGAPVKLGDQASVEAILAAERVRGIFLPNDYRALLSLHDGMIVLDRRFFATRDYREDTSLTQAARGFLQTAAERGVAGIEACIPLAQWGRPNDWLLYDPLGKVHGGKPGYVVMLDAQAHPMKDLCDALASLEKLA